MRNMMTGRSSMPPTGHALGRYTEGLGKGTFTFPITAPKTAQHVAKQVERTYADGRMFSLGMEDGVYDSYTSSATFPQTTTVTWPTVRTSPTSTGVEISVV
jgi:hypothetical protein